MFFFFYVRTLSWLASALNILLIFKQHKQQYEAIWKKIHNVCIQPSNYGWRYHDSF